MDLVVLLPGANQVAVYLGTGGGAFGNATTYAIGASGVFVRAGDLDGDGHPDVVVAHQINGQFGTLSVLGANANGTLKAAVSLSDDVVDTRTLEIVDVTGDGKRDIFVGGWWAFAGTAPCLQTFVNTGNGTFAAPVPADCHVYTGAGSVGVTPSLADFDGDGVLDAAVDDWTIWKGRGDGSFNYQQVTTVSPAIASISLGADVTGDGKPDLLGLNLLDLSINVAINTTP
jgi:hypothetical protein